jgi:hypothetical protein
MYIASSPARMAIAIGWFRFAIVVSANAGLPGFGGGLHFAKATITRPIAIPATAKSFTGADIVFTSLIG